MTNPVSPMTRLDAVNQMLSSIGQSPLNTLTGVLPKDAQKAALALDTVLREVLNKGWSFNTDTNFKLSPDVNNHILIPSTALWVDPEDPSQDFVIRWDNGVAKFYDRENQTFEVDADVECRIIWAFSFEEIPQAARHYIAMRAGRIFQSQIIGSQVLFQFTELHESEAFATFKRMEKRTNKYNYIARSPIRR